MPWDICTEYGLHKYYTNTCAYTFQVILGFSLYLVEGCIVTCMRVRKYGYGYRFEEHNNNNKFSKILSNSGVSIILIVARLIPNSDRPLYRVPVGLSKHRREVCMSEQTQQVLVKSRDGCKRNLLSLLCSPSLMAIHPLFRLVMASGYRLTKQNAASHLVIEIRFKTSSSPDNAHQQICSISSSPSASGAEKRENEIPELPMPPKSAINEESPKYAHTDTYIHIRTHE